VNQLNGTNLPHSLVDDDLTLRYTVKQPVDRFHMRHDALRTDAMETHGVLEEVRRLAEPSIAVMVEPAQQSAEHVHLAPDHERIVRQQLTDAVRR